MPNYNATINKYGKYLTEAQRQKLLNQLRAIKNSYASNRQDAYLQTQAAKAAQQRQANALGLGASGYALSQQQRMDRNLSEYGRAFEQAEQYQLDNAAVQLANETIRAQNEAARAAAQAAAESAARQRAATLAANAKRTASSSRTSRFNRNAAQQLIDEDKAARDAAPPVKPKPGGASKGHRNEQEVMVADKASGYKSVAELQRRATSGSMDFLQPDFTFNTSVDRSQRISVQDAELLKSPEMLKELGTRYQAGIAEYQGLMDEINSAYNAIESVQAVENNLRSAYARYQNAEAIYSDTTNSSVQRAQALRAMQDASKEYNTLAAKYNRQQASAAEVRFYELMESARAKYDDLKHSQYVLWYAAHNGYDPIMAQTGVSTEDAFKEMWTSGGAEIPTSGEAKQEYDRAYKVFAARTRYAYDAGAQEAIERGEAKTGLAQFMSKRNGALMTLNMASSDLFAKANNAIGKLYRSEADPVKVARMLGGMNTDLVNADTLDALTANDVDFLNYLYANGDTDTIKAYLFELTNAVNAQKGQQMAGSIQPANPSLGYKFNRFLAESASNLWYGIGTGYKGMAQEIGALTGITPADQTPASAWAYKMQQIQQNQLNRGWNPDAANVYNSSLISIGNMLPSIAVGQGASALAGKLGAATATAGKIGSAASALSLGGSAAGQAYQDAINQGYDHAQALKYGTLNGASEAALEYALGGIAKIGKYGLTQAGINATVKMLPKAWQRVAARYGLEMLSEFSEEYLQEVLDPMFRNLALGEHNEFKPLSKEALMAGISGAVTAAFMNGFGIRSDITKEQYMTQMTDELMDMYGFTEDEAEFMAETKLIIDSGGKLSRKELQRYGELGMRFKGALNSQRNQFASQLTAGADTVRDRVAPFLQTGSESEAVLLPTLSKEARENYLTGKLLPSVNKTGSRVMAQTEAAKVKIENGSVLDISRMSRKAARDAVLNKATTYTDNGLRVVTLNGKALDLRSLPARQRYNYRVLQKAQEALPNLKLVVHDTIPLDNASVQYSDGSLHIALDSENAAPATLAHELLHEVRLNMPEAYEELSAFIRETAKDDLIKEAEGIVDSNYADAKLTDEQYREEVDAHIVEKLFTDEDYLDRIVNGADVPAKRTLLTKLKEIVDKIVAAFKGTTAPRELQRIRDKVTEAFAKLNESLGTAPQQAGAMASMRTETGVELEQGETTDVSAAYDNGDVVVDKDGSEVAVKEGDNMMFSIRTYEEDGRRVLDEWLDKAVEENRKDPMKGIDEKQAGEIRAQMQMIYDVCKQYENKYATFGKWSRAKVVRDATGRPVFSVVKANGEYVLNLDFSLVCKKRRTLDAVFNRLIKRGVLESLPLNEVGIVGMNKIIKKYGFETACDLCFVDAKRYRQMKVARSFTEEIWNPLVESMAEGTDARLDYFEFAENATRQHISDGLDTRTDANMTEIDRIIKEKKPKRGGGPVDYRVAKYLKEHPEARKLLSPSDFMSTAGFDAIKQQAPDILKLYNAKKGTGGPKAAFSDVQYLNEVLTGKTFNKEAAYSVGGVRVQSFSDFVARMVFDYAQMVADLSAKELPAHAYTKEQAFVQLFGLTGMKINMSLIPAVVKGGIAPGLDANGNYAWATESFDYDEALKIQKDALYGKNCGTIAVGISTEHILKLLRDPNIRMVIPYHKSGLNHVVAAINNIDQFHDYTDVQNTRHADGTALTKAEKKNEFNFNDALHKAGATADPRAIADQYLAWCDEHDYLPKFDEFRGEENYYKLLEDFTLFDEQGNYCPQEGVRMAFPTEDSAFGSFASLVDGALDKDNVEEFRRNRKLDSICDDIERELPSYVEQYGGMDSRRMPDSDYLSLAEKYKSGKATEEEKAELEKAVEEAAKERMKNPAVNKRGNLLRLYHGTPSFGFTRFSTKTVFTTPNKSVAAGYGGGKSWAEPRSIKDTYVKDDGTDETLIKNARNVLHYELKTFGKAEAKAVREGLRDRVYNLAEKVNDAWAYGETFPETTSDVDNAIAWVLSFAGDVMSYYEGDYTEEDLRSGLQHFWDNKEIARDWFRDHRDEIIAAGNRPMYDFIMGYDLNDLAADVETKLLNSLHPEQYLMYANSDRFVSKEWLRDQTEYLKDVGAYELFGDLGDKPLVIDTNGAFWASVPAPMIGEGTYTTEDIVNWAKENDYTSVIFKKVLDPAMNNYSPNIAEDVYAFFSPSQLKSADPVTYDDEGNIIPLSKRFNTERDDIRESRRASESQLPVLDTTDLHYVFRQGEGVIDVYQVEIDYERGSTDFKFDVLDTDTGERFTREGTANPDLKGKDVEQELALFLKELKRDKMSGLPTQGTVEDVNDLTPAEAVEVMPEYPRADQQAAHAAVKNGYALIGPYEVDVYTGKWHDTQFTIKALDTRTGERFTRTGERVMALKYKDVERAVLDFLRNPYGATVAMNKDQVDTIKAREQAKAQQAIAKARERQLRSELKEKTLKGVKHLTTILSKPTQTQHVPIQLAVQVSDAVKTINEYVDGNTKRGQTTLSKLALAYKRAFDAEAVIAQAREENPNYDPRGSILSKEAYDQDLEDMMHAVQDIIEVKDYKDLTTYERQLIYNTVRGIQHTVTEANKLISDRENKLIWRAGDQMINELESAPKMPRAIRGYMEEMLDLRRLALMFSNSNDRAMFVRLVDGLNQGAIEKARIEYELRDIFREVTDKYGDEIRTWYGKDAEWLDTGLEADGNPVRITKGMRVSLALHVLNGGNMRHIERGGLTIPDVKLYNAGRLSEAYAAGQRVPMNKAGIEAIIANMTEAERAYVEAAKILFHDRAGYYINKTSLRLVGYAKAIVDNYFPIHSNSNYTRTDFETIRKNGSLEKPGFLEERVVSSNPVYLEDITFVVNRQISGVARYAGLAIPMRNYKCVTQAVTWFEDENGIWRERTSVPETMTNVLGERGVKIVDGFLEDWSEAAHTDVTPMERLANKLSGNYVKAVLLGNAKVAMKQMASYPTAAAVIPWKYLNKALVAGGKNGRLISRADAELINKYTPLYRMRLEQNVNEIASIMTQPGMEQKMPWLLGWITKMDVATVGRLWYAAQYMVDDTQQNLEKGSDEYYQAVAKIFNDCIQQTQPNFTPLQRNAALRNKNPIVRSLVLFGTQRMQNGGIMIEAATELLQSKGKSTEQIKAAKRKLGRAIASQMVQNVILIAATFGVDALRGRIKAWQDDDDDKLTAESVLKKLGDTFLGNFVGSFLGGTEAYETISDIFKVAKGKYVYGDNEFSIPAIDAVETLLSFVKSDLPGFVKYMTSGEHTADERLARFESFGMKLAKAAGYALGLPFENALKDFTKGWIPAIQDIADAAKTGELNLWLHQSGRLDNKKTAERYKTWIAAGHKGSEFFEWDKKLTSVSGGRSGRIRAVLTSNLSDEDKVLLMQMYDPGEGKVKDTLTQLLGSEQFKELNIFNQVKTVEAAYEYAATTAAYDKYANGKRVLPIGQAAVGAMTKQYDSFRDYAKDKNKMWVYYANEYANSISSSPTALMDFLTLRSYINSESFAYGDADLYEKQADMQAAYIESLDVSETEKLYLLQALGVKKDIYDKAVQLMEGDMTLSAKTVNDAFNAWQDITVETAHNKATMTEEEYAAWNEGNERKFREYLNGEKLTGRERFELLNTIAGGKGWYNKATAAWEDDKIGYDKTWAALYEYEHTEGADDDNDGKIANNESKGYRFREWLNGQSYTAEEKLRLMQYASSGSSWLGSADKMRELGISYSTAWDALYKYEHTEGTDDEKKGELFRGWLDEQTKLSGSQKLHIENIIAGGSWLEKYDAAPRDQSAADGFYVDISENDYWDYRRYYDTHPTYTDDSGKEVKRGYQFQQHLNESSLSAQTRFYLLETSNASSSWYEKSVEAYTEHGISYDLCWRVAFFAAGESGAGKKDRIIAYAKKLGLTSSQAAWLQSKFG